jgi:predicted transcriptional regulator
VGLGLSRADAEVYVHLAKKGPIEIMNLAKVLKFSKQKLRRSIKNLQSKGIVIANLEENELFSALPFEQTIELLIEIKTEQAQIMQESKEELLSSWRKMTKDKPEKS